MSYPSYDTPAEFFGPGYTVDAGNNEIQLNTSGSGTESLSIGTFTTAFATDNRLTIAAHGLSVGHIVNLTSSTTLPAPLVAGTNYWVKTVPTSGTLTLSATNGGDEITLTDNGTGTHTLFSQPILANLTDAQAAASTAQVVFAVLEGVNTRFSGIPTADKPTKFNITQNAYLDTTTNEWVYNYAVTCRVTAGSLTAVNS